MDGIGSGIGKLGFGLMRLPVLEDGKIDIGQTKKMVDLFMEAGFTYFDTAWAYAGSEDAIRQALVERYPRESSSSPPRTRHGSTAAPAKTPSPSSRPPLSRPVRDT